MNSTTFNGNMSWTSAFYELSFTNNYPKVNEKTVSVPGMNGVIDLTEYPLGYPTYGQREVSWKYECKLSNAYAAFRAFADRFYGKQVSFAKSEIPGYVFNGRITDIKLSQKNSTWQMDMKAKCNPFMEAESYDTSGKITLGTEQLPLDYEFNYSGNVPVVPEFLASSAIYVKNVDTDETVKVNTNSGTVYTSTPEIYIIPGWNHFQFWKATNAVNMYMRWKELKL